MLYISQATLWTPVECLKDGALLIEGAHIAAVGRVGEVPCPPETRRMDASGLVIAPGFIDLQFNGGFGRDFTHTPETIWEVAAQLPQHGVTAFLPTIITAPLETSAAARAVLRQPPTGFQGATPLGLHIEGPFLNPQKRGAHNPAYLRLPEVSAVADWSPEQGVRLVTLAPELPGALETIRALRARGVVVSAGHSMATYDEARRGFEAGITYGTHLYNAMPPLDHRAPGLIGALLTQPGVSFGLIPDGVHMHPALVDLAWRAAGPERITLVTDAMAALGMSPGRYQLADFDVVVDHTAARLADGRLAGSILRLDQAVRNLIAFTGCSLSDALRTVTINPARLLGLAHARGRIAPGLLADLVWLTPDLHVVATMVQGELLYTAPEAALTGTP